MTVQQKVFEFFEKYNPTRYEKGEVIIQANMNPKGVYYVVSGQVVQYDISATGDRVVVNVFQEPAFFPMSWAINKTPNAYFFEAFTDVAVRRAPVAEVVKFVRDNPDVAYDLLSRVYKGTDGLQRRMLYMMENDAGKRLLVELVISAERFGEERRDSIFVPLHEGELAARVGLARETANRALRELKETDLISVDRQGIHIKSLEALRRALER